MFIGHLPAGYLVARSLWRNSPRIVFLAGLIGAVLPDIDMLWFHFVDHGGVHHHQYITHRPAIWAAILALGALLRNQIVIALGIGALVHMVLDTIAGAIAWGWPFSDAATPLVVVPATHDNWIMSFLTHWTFQVEIALTLVALTIAIRANFFSDTKV